MISNYKLHAIDLVRSGEISPKDLLLDIYETMAHRDLAEEALKMSGADLNGEVSVAQFVKFLEYIRERDVYDSLAMNGHVPDLGDLDGEDEDDFSDSNTGHLHESMNSLVSTLMNSTKEKSFKEYVAEAGAMITPPSGQTIAPTSNASSQQSATAAKAPQAMKAIWPGKGAPVEVGMTVGLKGPNGLPVPGSVSQVDMAAKGVKVKNPTTGQDEWTNMDALEPFMAQGQQNQNIQPGQQPTAEDAQDLARMRKLAGISEDCSGGATGAGAIAVAPAAMGKVKRRTDPVEESPSLEHPVAGNKTIVGATGPQASAIGKLSANNAARGKKTASRINNGMKKT